MILDYNYDASHFNVSYIDNEGYRKMERFFMPNPTKWDYAGKGDSSHPKYTSWDGKKVVERKAYKPNMFKQMEWLWKIKESGKYDHIFEYTAPPKITFLDIETWVPERGVSDFKKYVSDANCAVTAISVVSSNICLSMGYKELDYKEVFRIEQAMNNDLKKAGLPMMKFKYKKFDNELEMLHFLFKELMPKVTILTGWNVVFFDWCYLVNRYKNYGFVPTETSLTGTLRKNLFPDHFGLIDYAEIFKKWDTSIDVKESNSLDFVSSQVLKMNKISYKGSLNDLYTNDFSKYIEYNAFDTILVKYIDMKKGLINLMGVLSSLCFMPLSKADKATVIGNHLLSKGFWERGTVIPFNYEDPDEDSEYEGAFVKDPVTGFYKFVVCFDFASLYPTIIRQFNVSPESYLGVFEEASKELEKYRNDIDKIVTVNRAVYTKNPSVLATTLTGLYFKRKEYQKDMKDKQAKAEGLKEILYRKHGIMYGK